MSTFFKLLVTSICCLSITIGAGQNQNKKWYFGDRAALDFISGSPIPITTGQLSTQEGCSSISDNSGVLLFYTDGKKVWNRNNLVMSNGTGLLGDPSTTQSALIVPKPGSISLYYIFTIDDLGGAMTYSIVDMSLAGGLGDVTTKNTMLHSSVCEKQAAILKCDGNIWIISHQFGSNTFYSDLLTPSGISPSVLSSVGTIHTGGNLFNYNSIGQMKISQQGDRIALAIRDLALFEVFNFDIGTGTVSNPITINPGAYPVAYGVEFSPDGSKLYGGIILGHAVYQFNLLAGTSAAISASATLVGSTSNFTSAFQLGPDGKIYIAKSISQTSGSGYLDVINNPNLSGTACNYTAGGCSLGSKLSLLGLPGFMIRPRAPGLAISSSGGTTICEGQSINLSVTGTTSAQWSGGGVIALGSSINVTPAISTTYYVKDSNACGIVADTIDVIVDHIININVSATEDSICDGQPVNIIASGSPSYQWTGGVNSTAASVSVSPPVTTDYYVSGASNACPSDIDTVTIYVNSEINMATSGSVTLCIGDSAVLSAFGAASYTWSGPVSANSSSITVAPTVNSEYYVTGVGNTCGSDTDTILVTVAHFIKPEFNYELDACEQKILFFNSSQGAATYLWDFGDGTQSILENPAHPYSPGGYNVVLYVNQGTSCVDSVSRVITVNYSSADVLIPNVFTPNNDLVNDEFIISGLSECKTYHLDIYNRWGQKVYETDSPQNKFWNGKNGEKKEIVEGVYYYILSSTMEPGISGMITVLK